MNYFKQPINYENKKYETVINRLQIGLTKLNHEYLMAKEKPPTWHLTRNKTYFDQMSPIRKQTSENNIPDQSNSGQFPVKLEKKSKFIFLSVTQYQKN